ncbi:GNAT family N-acetyltransferase [Chitinophaga vietnamensis]|uniref:GNAT family N-acetyltransferase n=1 Tax=Chitinophaga vietnamensis TaxID=2593957 RepID=UPI00117751C4|nr:GNAT family N-acetyltransferase [Chitinophaga vietnamensis]
MITLHAVTRPHKAVKPLYESAFPYNERRDWPLQLELFAAERLHLYELYKDDVFAGFATWWHTPAFCFIEHLAIADTMRGGGIGTQFMQALEKELGALVLEVELPLTEQAKRRIVFYERLGFSMFMKHYYQPPYHKGYSPLELRLMYKGLKEGDAAFEGVKQTLDHIYKYLRIF